MKKQLIRTWGTALTMLGLFFLFSLFINPEELFSNTVFYNFQGRDLARAHDILAGHWMFYGPEMTGGGNLPGPLYYMVLAVGLIFNKTWISAWAIQYLFTFIAAAVGFYYFRKKSHFVAMAWVILFATAPLTAWFVKLFLNVSYLLPFAVGSLIAIHYAFTREDEQSRRKFYYLASVLIGAGLQFHFSIIFLWLAILFMIALADKLRLPRFSKKTTLTGALLFLIPSLPHLVWLVCSHLDIHFGKPAFYSGEAEKALPSIIFLIKSSLGSPLPKLLASWTNKIFFTVPFALFPFLFVKNDSKNDPSLKVLLVCLAFSFIPYFNWYLSPQANRYTILFFLGLNFLTAYKLKSLLENTEQISRFEKAAVATLLISWIYTFIAYPDNENRLSLLTNLALIAGIYSFIAFAYKKKEFALALSLAAGLSHMQKLAFPETVFYTKSIEGYMPSYQDWKHIFTTIQNETGWDYETMKRRVYFVGHHVNQDPGLFSEAQKLPSQFRQNNPDGFIISNRYKARLMTSSPRNWMLKQNLHKDILAALKNDDLQLGENLSDVILIAPYFVKKETFIPRHFHNLGEGYLISDEDLKLGMIKENEGTAKIDHGMWLFKWNECPDAHPFCSTGAFVKLAGNQLNVRVIGAAVSQITPWVSPNFTQSWTEPFVEIKCGPTVEKFMITSSLGFTRNYSHSSKTFFFAGNNSFVAPFERTFHIHCRQKPEALTLGRAGSQIEMVVNVRTLPAKSLTVKL